jgi:hypothetical protein
MECQMHNYQACRKRCRHSVSRHRVDVDVLPVSFFSRFILGQRTPASPVSEAGLAVGLFGCGGQERSAVVPARRQTRVLEHMTWDINSQCVVIKEGCRNVASLWPATGVLMKFQQRTAYLQILNTPHFVLQICSIFRQF